MSTTFQGNTGTSLQAFDPSFGPNTPGRDLSAYMTSVNSIAILTPEHELELAKQYYYDDNVDAARQLVLAHLRFVVHLAKSYSGYGLSQADLIQEGNVGLMKAVKRYNPEVGVRLVSFAVHWIKAEMHEFIRMRLHHILGDAAEGVRILYGGSVKPGNATEILGIANVDGALVGGASLKAADFGPIIGSAQSG